jgi:hypothetical protein
MADPVLIESSEPPTPRPLDGSTSLPPKSSYSEWVFGRWTTARTVIWILLTICITKPMAPPFLKWFRNQGGTIMDYYQEWSSARSVILHQPVYQPTRELAPRDFGRRFNSKAPWNLGYNVHPPTSVLLALPFGYLSYFDSFFAWSVFTLSLFGLSLYLIARHCDYRLGWLSALPITCGCLLSSPFWHQFQQGQLNPLILFFMTLSWIHYRTNRPWRAGFWLGLAAATKVVPGFLVIYFLTRREWKNFAAVIAGFMFATAITIGVLGLQTYVDYARLVLPEALDWRSANTNASLPGLWCKLFDPGPRGGHYRPLIQSPVLAKCLTVTSWLAVLAILVPIWRRAKSKAEVDLAFGLAIVGMLLLSPVTWDHYFLLLPLPLITIWMNIPPKKSFQLLYLAILAGLAAPAYLWIDLYLPQTSSGTGVSPLQTLLLPTFSCYMLCGLLGLGAVAAREITRRVNPQRA